jgi:hypothetical protein
MVPDKVYVSINSAVVAVPDNEPANVVAVILLSPIVIPEPVDNCVLPEAVLRTVPTKYLVPVVASVLTLAAEVAVPENVVAVIVFPRIEMFVST